MQKFNLKYLVFGIAGLFVLFVALVFTGVIPGLREKADKPTVTGSITVWTVGEETRDREKAWKDLVKSFQGTYPGVKVESRNFRTYESYENALADSFGSGETPDVFMVSNTAFPRYENKLAPAPASLFSLESLRALFPKTVENDFVSEGKIYALPLSIDTLALIYNRNLIDQAAVAVPKTWAEFESAVPQLTRADVSGIQSAGAAIGTAGNVPYAADIISLLMLQRNIPMTAGSRAVFNTAPGKDALGFYTQFADRAGAAYSWNETMPQATDFFAQEKVGMLIGYRSTIDALKSKNSFLDIGVAEIPSDSASSKKSFARYMALAVSKQSKSQPAAWAFVSAVSTNETWLKPYLALTKEAPALRSLALLSKDDPAIGVFSRQALTATTWKQADDRAVASAFQAMIESVNTNEKTPERALDDAAAEISRSMQKK
jgi:ABC-type glycerol-3-phosphate transport system substrate-binding protein